MQIKISAGNFLSQKKKAYSLWARKTFLSTDWTVIGSGLHYLIWIGYFNVYLEVKKRAKEMSFIAMVSYFYWEKVISQNIFSIVLSPGPNSESYFCSESETCYTIEIFWVSGVHFELHNAPLLEWNWV